MTSVVYFAQAASGAVKIGWTADLPRRTKNIQCGSHEPIDIVTSLHGDASLEAHFHQRFAEDRIHGEWFRASPELLDLIRRIKAGLYQAPCGFQPETPSKQGLDLKLAGRQTLGEARELIGVIAGPLAMGEKVKTTLGRVAVATGLRERRIRAIWHREARAITAAEMDCLRRVATLRVPGEDVARPSAREVGEGHDGAGCHDRSVDRGAAQ